MDAEDILQESFIQVFKKIKELKDEKAFARWLKKIVINKSISELRKRKIRFEPIDDFIGNEMANETETIEASLEPEVVNHAIKELPSSFRTIVNLHVFVGKKHREIAQMLDITESTSKARYKQAKTLLAQSLNNYLNHED